MRYGHAEEQIGLRNQLLELTNFENVPIFEFSYAIRKALQEDSIQEFQMLSFYIKEVLKHVVPPETLLPPHSKPDFLLQRNSYGQSPSPKSHFKIMKKMPSIESAVINPFLNLNKLVAELREKKKILDAHIEDQIVLKKEKPFIEKYNNRLDALDKIKANLEALIQVYVNYVTTLKDASVDENIRKSLIEGRPIIVGIGFQPVYLKQDKAEAILKGKTIGGCSHIVVRVDDIYFKRNPHGTHIEFAIDNFNKTLNNEGSTPTTLIKLYSGQEVILMQASRAVSGPLLHCALGCDVFITSEVPSIKNLKSKNSSSYIRSGSRLYYACMISGTMTEIPISKVKLENFDANLKPTFESQSLSVEQLNLIAHITGHTRHLSEIEKKVSGRSFSAQIASSLSVHPGDGKADNMVLTDGGLVSNHEAGAIVLIDQDVGFVESFVLLKNGNHLPATKNVLYCWSALMDTPFDLSLREHLMRQSPSIIIVKWLLNCYAQNQEYRRLLEEGVLSSEEYEDLKLPIQFVPGTISRIYKDLQNIIEWCKGNEVTHNELFKYVDPRLHLFYKHISTLSVDPREAYYKGFHDAKDVEDLKITGLSSNDLADCKRRMYDFEDKRAQSIESAIGELMSIVKFSSLSTKPKKTGEEVEPTQFLMLLKSFPHLKEITFQDNDFLTDDLVHKLSPWPMSLQKLNLVRCPNISFRGISEITYYAPNIELLVKDCKSLVSNSWPFELAKNRKFTWILEDGYPLSYPRHLMSGLVKHPMHEAVRAGSVEAMQIILASGGSLKATNEAGETPYFDALRSDKSEDIFFAMLNAGKSSDLNIRRSDGAGLFHIAASLGNLFALKLIFSIKNKDKKVPGPLGEQDLEGRMALHHAIAGSQMVAAEWLLDKGADLNHLSAIGTPLFIAAKLNHLPLVQMLLGRQPDKIVESEKIHSELVIDMQKYLLACDRMRKLSSQLTFISLPSLENQKRTFLKEYDLEENAKILFQLGKEAVATGGIKAALIYFLQSASLQDDNREYSLHLAAVSYSLGMFSESKKIFKKNLSENDARLVHVESNKLACDSLKIMLDIGKNKVVYDPAKVKSLIISPESKLDSEGSKQATPHPYLKKLLSSWFDKFYFTNDEEEAELALKSLKSKIPANLHYVLDEFLREKSASFSAQLYGRDAEIEVIQNLYSDISQGNSAFLLISGDEGTGKTELIKKVLQPSAAQRGFFVSGKCDQVVRHPFAVISEALNTLVKLLLKKEEDMEVWKEKISSTLSTNAALMLKFIPSLKKIIGDVIKSDLQITIQNEGFLFERLFVKFIQIFNSESHPLVIFLDDLQWADTESLSLLQQLLLSDKATNKHLLIVGTFRPAECKESHPLRKLEKTLIENERCIVSLHLSKLSKEQITQLVSGVLSWPRDKNRESLELLSSKIYQNTNGNPFYTQQLLLSMRRNQYLVYNPKTQFWHIDESRKNLIPTKIAEILVDRLKDLTAEQRKMTSFAASLGNSFTLDSLALVTAKTTSQVRELLQDVISSALIFEVDPESEQYQFVHDTVQKEAQMLDLTFERELLERHFLIGKSLLAKSHGNLTESEIVIAMGHVNKNLLAIEKTLPSKERIFFAAKNLIAGLKTKETTAFSAANQFLESGILLINEEENPWVHHYELTCALYKAGIECSYIIGEHERAEKLFSIAVRNAKEPVEKAELYSYKLDSHSRRGEFKSALEAGSLGLSILGIKIDINSHIKQIMSLLPNLLKLFGDIQNKVADLFELSSKTVGAEVDPRDIMLTSLYSKMREVAILDRKPELYAALGMKTANFILAQKNPSPKLVGSVFSTVAVLLASLNRFDQARGCDAASLAFIEKQGLIEAMPLAYCVSALFIQIWHEPFPRLIEKLEMSFSTALETGQLSYANYTSGAIILYSAILYPIPVILDLYEKYYSFMYRSQHRIIMLGSNLLKTAALSLMDTKAFVAKPDLTEWTELAKKEGNSMIMMTYLYLFMTLCIQGHFEEILKLAALVKKEIKASANVVSFLLIRFYTYLASLRCGNANLNPLCSERELISDLESCVRSSRQFTHIYEFSLAEKKALEYKNSTRQTSENLQKIEKHYEDAITSAQEYNWLPGKAIAIEFFACFYEAIKKPEMSLEKRNLAMSAYREYGAKAKVDVLQRASRINVEKSPLTSKLWASAVVPSPEKHPPREAFFKSRSRIDPQVSPRLRDSDSSQSESSLNPELEAIKSSAN